MSPEYRPRIIDSYIKSHVELSGAISIQGISGCGKTCTAERFSKSMVKVTDVNNPGIIELARTSPRDIISGEAPRLIDEWQTAPQVWDAVRNVVDERGITGQFILTSSYVLPEDAYGHAGTGRVSRAIMRPMSLFESGESNGKVSLKDLFDGRTPEYASSDLIVRDVFRAMVRGGWPAIIDDGRDDGTYARNQLERVMESWMVRADGVRRNPSLVRKVLRSLARNISTPVKISTIVADVIGDSGSISDKTVKSYLGALSKIFVTEDIEAWNPSVRSATAIRTSAKKQFSDPSLAIAAMGLDVDGLLSDLRTAGFYFESLCDRDLRIYSQPIGGELFHYRDSSGLEADAVIHLKDGRWAPVEVKLGVDGIENGARNLLRLRDRVNTEALGEPSFLMVLTSVGTAYRRDDGVWVVPITCLGP